MNIEDLDFEPHPAGMGGVRAVVNFPNGFSASVVSGEFFYSTEDKPYELAVLRDGDITYDTPITDDVLGYLTADEVEAVLDQIAALPAMERT